MFVFHLSLRAATAAALSPLSFLKLFCLVNHCRIGKLCSKVSCSWKHRLRNQFLLCKKPDGNCHDVWKNNSSEKTQNFARTSSRSSRILYHDAHRLNWVCAAAMIVLSLLAMASSQCVNFQWQCENGECIDDDGKCDGITDCQDKSDETADACIHLSCPGYAYRCAYGACVAGSAKCNKKKDCADNSDEVALLCAPNVQELQKRLQGNCSNFAQYQCASGECIDDELKCDGRIDCKDASDETVELCASMYCPSYAFRCGYGGCVSGGARCDGLKDCRDGSDETAQLCGYEKVTTPRTPISPITPTRPSGSTPTPRPATAGCQIPNDRENLIAVYQGDKSVIERNEIIPDSAIVDFTCERRYNLVGKKTNLCTDKSWLNPVPACEKFCPKSDVTEGISSSAICEYNGSTVPCGDEIRPGTHADIKCNEGYVRPYGHFVKRLICLKNGNWDHRKESCSARCGEVSETVTAFISGGVATNITEVPWQVAIYNIFNEADYKHICGGTIISAILVVSAAHCFWDEANEKQYKAEYYTIYAGKYFSDYNMKEQTKPQARNITQIIVHPEFKGVESFFPNDIAIIVLVSPLRFTKNIVPICYDFGERNNAVVKSNILGRFAGWGTTGNGSAARELQSINLPTLSFNDCRDKLLPSAKDTLTNDKFCVFDRHGASLCQGDSGGGLAVPRTFIGSQKQIYYLLGVLSNAPGYGIQCADSRITALTNINFYEAFITDVESKYRIY